MLQHECCYGDAHYSAYKQIFNHVVVGFDFFRAILESIFSLDLVNISSDGCMLYLDDVLLFKLQKCCIFVRFKR